MKRRRSPAAASLLALVLGPLGLVYVSVSQALVGVLIALIIIPVAIAMYPSSAALILAIFWILIVVCAFSTAEKINAEADERDALEERRHNEMLEAVRQAAGEQGAKSLGRS